ncbi:MULTISPECIES: hypothetical protein [Rhodococcus]|nr:MULTISPECIES: hypothetical protein [Rhodococcus]
MADRLPRQRTAEHGDPLTQASFLNGDSMPKTIIPVIATLWVILAVIGAWSTIAFAIAVLAAVVLGTYLLASAVTGPGNR